MAMTDTFSMSTMFNALPNLTVQETKKYPRGVSDSMPPPGFSPRASVKQDELFDIMTDPNGVATFKDTISELNTRDLLKMVYVLTSDSDYFVKIVGDKFGSMRVQKLLGYSDVVDGFLCIAILHRFLEIMTRKYASYVAVRAMVVFDKQKKDAMYHHILHHALDIACDPHGCIALSEIMIDEDDLYYRTKLLDLVAFNALSLSNDLSGNYVVQNVLKLYDLRTTHNVMASLRGHCVELSFKKHGSYIVERLLEASEESVFVVIRELLECEGDRLMRLARSGFGNFVVAKALMVTKEMHMFDLFWGLVHKLMPFLGLLRNSRGRDIANILESVI